MRKIYALSLVLILLSSAAILADVTIRSVLNNIDIFIASHKSDMKQTIQDKDRLADQVKQLNQKIQFGTINPEPGMGDTDDMNKTATQVIKVCVNNGDAAACEKALLAFKRTFSKDFRGKTLSGKGFDQNARRIAEKKNPITIGSKKTSSEKKLPVYKTGTSQPSN